MELLKYEELKMQLAGKIALITGASRGIGNNIALELAKNGAVVIGTATTPAGADKITADLQKNKYAGRGIVLDVTSNTQVSETIDALAKEFGAIHILVNNAGIVKDNLLMRMKEEEWDKVIDTNLTGIYRVTKACIKSMMKARWGRIINISSVVAMTGNPGAANYCAAKAGILGFTKSLALEIASRNITVNTIAPGFIETDMTGALTEEQQQAILTKVPLGRMGTAAEISGAVVFLTSDSASYITGETINVNGGMYMA